MGIIPRFTPVEKKAADELLELGPPLPALVLEGDTDEHLYSSVLRAFREQVGSIEILIVDGKKNVLKLLESGGVSANYVCLVDRDHDEFRGCYVQHPKLVYTHYYSAESYLALDDVVGAFLHLWGDGTIDAKSLAGDIVGKGFEIVRPVGAAVLKKLEYRWDIPLEGQHLARWRDKPKIGVNFGALVEYIREALWKLNTMIDRTDLYEVLSDGLSSWDRLSRADQMKYIPGKMLVEALFWVIEQDPDTRKILKRLSRPRLSHGDLANHVYGSADGKALVEKLVRGLRDGHGSVSSLTSAS